MSIDIKKVRNHVIALVGCYALVRLLVWLSWGLWAVTR